MTTLSVRREVGEFRKRYKWMALAAVLAFGAVVVRLVQLQVAEHRAWSAEALDNVTRQIRRPAIRGLLRDRSGSPIATNRPSYDVYVTPQLLDEADQRRIAKLMDLDEGGRLELGARIAAVPERRRSHLVEAFRDVTREQYAALETHRGEIAGLELVATPGT
jgi:penicillin-binding protein 2